MAGEELLFRDGSNRTYSSNDHQKPFSATDLACLSEKFLHNDQEGMLDPEANRRCRLH